MSKKKKVKETKPHTVRFDGSDVDSFYYKELVMPAAAIWNFDEVLSAYMAAGINGLLNGFTAWDKPTRKKLRKAQKLFEEYVRDTNDPTKRKPEGGNKALRIVAEIGIERLWD